MQWEEQHNRDHIQMEGYLSNKTEICDDCHGSGMIDSDRCSSCNGRGVI